MKFEVLSPAGSLFLSALALLLAGGCPAVNPELVECSASTAARCDGFEGYVCDVDAGHCAVAEAGDDDDDSGDEDDSATDDDDAAGDDDDTTVPSNYAIEFDQDEDFAASAPTTAVGIGDEFTIEFWFQRTGEVQGYLIDTRQPGLQWDEGNWAIYQFDAENQAVAFFQVTEDGSRWLLGPDLNVLGLGWHHFAVVRTGSGIVSMYIDGALEAYEQYAPIEWTLPAPLLLGDRYERNTTGTLQNAVLDEVRLSTTGVYQTPFAPQRQLTTETATALFWHLDEGQGNTATDEILDLELVLSDLTWVEVTP